MPLVTYNQIQHLNCDDAHGGYTTESISGCIDIWAIPISSNLHLIETFKKVLPKKELERSLRYHQEKDRQQFLVNRIVLRLLLATYTKSEPECLVIGFGNNKKPFLVNNKLPHTHFNISHSHDLILMAFSKMELGIDIEWMDKSFSYQDLLGQNFSKDEINFIKMGQDISSNFYLLWTRKEAVLKATSYGLNDTLSLVPSLDGAHSISSGYINSDENWKVSSFQIAENYMGSIAYNEKIKNIRFRQFNNLAMERLI
ncbi:MAG: 4'-phosphopantetheinyl transferase superfamily protein [Bacteroidetes bacterium]|nr:4'-phosphopantetheinyl transferase superfamily protein [Bacteroidota bacterium]